MTLVVGIDPGPMTGLLGLQVGDMADDPVWGPPVIIQCDAGTVRDVLMGVFRYRSNDIVVAVEDFAESRHAQRGNDPAARKATRAVIAECRQWAAECEWRCYLRRAAEVKPWATDERLRRAGLYDPTAGMRHARDGARHALFVAVRHLGAPDPLSSRAGAR